MANIYEPQSESLHKVLDRARTEDGATVVIPELQRPYVWTPNKVILLVDSLIRGWPFGTLLMWKVNHEDLAGIPHRTFWRTVDCTDSRTGTAAPRRDPPATYQMVLDGQQRIQSLFLAVGGDNSGFKLEDRNWVEELQDRRPRGRQPKHKHWSKASLCFDLISFQEEYEKTGGLLSIDFRSVLKWAITDPTDGQSTWPKPDNYVEPLIKAYEAPHNSRLVRLSRLWQEAQPNPNLKEKDFRQIVREFLTQQSIPDATVQQLLEPIGEFMTTLRDVKLAKITYLELVPFDQTLWERDAYNDAIVNIFTRLNTAGRTLTREEITFAWLKSNWDEAQTESKSATKCFQELLDELKERGLKIEMDELVNAVSFLWSVRFNDGKLLANSDLLKGAVIRPMAADLSANWRVVRNACLEVIEVVQERGFAFGPSGQFSSMNALAVLWSWRSLALMWKSARSLPVLSQDAFDKQCHETLIRLIDRWLLCSTWAGRWAESSNTAVAGYAKDLAGDWRNIVPIDDPTAVCRVLDDRLTSFVRGLETEAITHVNSVMANSRERVSIYRNLLWIWHRLDGRRWDNSKIPLRSGKGKTISLEVDHSLSYALWERRTTATLPSGCADVDEALGLANLFGNCRLLEKSFNISKSDKSLRSFMEQVHEFKNKQKDLNEWAESLGITPKILDPDSASNDEIADALRKSDSEMRSELVEFVKGNKMRADV